MRHGTPPPWDLSMRDRLLDGEAAALGELYDRFASLAYGIAWRVLGDEEETAEVTAEVFVHLWEFPGDVDPDRGPMRSWIADEAHRRAVERLRDRLRRAGATPPTGPEQPAEPTPDGLRSAATAARADYVFAAMPSPLREALDLARFQHRDYRQTARELGITEAEACHRLRLGLQLVSAAAAHPLDPVAGAALAGGTAAAGEGRR